MHSRRCKRKFVTKIENEQKPAIKIARQIFHQCNALLTEQESESGMLCSIWKFAEKIVDETDFNVLESLGKASGRVHGLSLCVYNVFVCNRVY